MNYEPSRKLELAEDVRRIQACRNQTCWYGATKAISNPRNFYQAGVQYRSMNEQDKSDLIANLAGDLNKVTDKRHQNDDSELLLSRADKQYGTRLAKATGTSMSRVENSQTNN